LWVAHLLLHRLEALVRLSRPCTLDRFTQLTLEGLALTPAPDLERLAGLLPFDGPTLRQLLGELTALGLVRADASGRWNLTDVGNQARQSGQFSQPSVERRAFYFLENGHADRPPAFVHLPAGTASAWPAPENWRFNLSLFKNCVTQSPEWKRRHGFPLDVTEILTPEANSSAAPDNLLHTGWQRVILDQSERLVTVLMLTRAQPRDERLLGFAVQQKGWVLNPAAPTLDLGSDWQTIIPDVVDDPPMPLWQQAWTTWADASGLSHADIDASRLERHNHHLRITLARPIVERLRAGHKGDVWLLAGENRFRAAALLELVERGSK
jgi:hypothetical protein